VTHHQSKVIQSNNYYPFGLQHTSSWTRSTERKNNRLYNAGSELNEQTKNYETFYRDYDPAIGRFNQIDPLAGSFSNLTPYNYAFNDPVALNDPNGDCPSCDFWEAVFAKLEDLGSSGSSTWTPGGGGAEGGAGGGGYGNSSYYGYNDHIGPGSGNHWSDGLETGPNGEAGRWRNFNYNEDDEIFITSTWVPAQDQNGGGDEKNYHGVIPMIMTAWGNSGNWIAKTKKGKIIRYNTNGRQYGNQHTKNLKVSLKVSYVYFFYDFFDDMIKLRNDPSYKQQAYINTTLGILTFGMPEIAAMRLAADGIYMLNDANNAFWESSIGQWFIEGMEQMSNPNNYAIPPALGD